MLYGASCAWLWPAVEPAVSAATRVALDRALEAAEAKVGRRLDDVPATCEVEHHPEDGTVLVLCTVCYRLREGETCR